jgi:hypothetical protein
MPGTIPATEADARDQAKSAVTSSDDSQRERAPANEGSTAAARQAFAACLARHGYYKGYYHH